MNHSLSERLPFLKLALFLSNLRMDIDESKCIDGLMFDGAVKACASIFYHPCCCFSHFFPSEFKN